MPMPKAPPGILSPKNDFVFKRIFGDANHIAPLSAFLQATLGLPEDEFAGLTITDPNLNPKRRGDKHCILDVRVTTCSGRDIDIEIQLEPSKELCNRIQYYTSRMVTEKVKRGKKYQNMPQSVSIAILDFKEWDDEWYHHGFLLYDPRAGLAYPNSMEIHTLELPKRPAKSDGTELWDWLAFLSSRTRQEFDSLAGKGSAMAEAVAKLKKLSASERERLLAEARDKWEWDNSARMRQKLEEGLEEGRAKGLAQGLAQGRADVARRMLRAKMPLAEIVALTGLSEAEVKRLSGKRRRGAAQGK